MIEFGKTLREARESKNLTIGQLAETTRIAPSVLEELEKEDFSKIAAPIYGRGFVKLYCNAVGLDPKPLIDEFMDILNGNHEPAIRERTVQTPTQPELQAADQPAAPSESRLQPEPQQPRSEPQLQPEPELPVELPPVAGEEPPPASDDFFQLEPESVHVASPATSEAVPEHVATREAFAPAAEQSDVPAFSRYAAPIRQRFEQSNVSSLWRLVLLSALALGLLWLICVGVRTLYRATSTAPVNPTDEEYEVAAPQPAPQVAPTAPAEPAVAPAQPAPAPVERTKQNIPSLYID